MQCLHAGRGVTRMVRTRLCLKRLFFFFSLMILLVWSGVFSVAAAEPFEIHMLDVGEGQCVLIEAEGRYMLVDGGGRGTSSFVVSYLKQQGVSSIDYIVQSHYDDDHMGGVIGALSVFPCQALFVPPYASDTELYGSFAKSALSNGCLIVHPEPGTVFELGSAWIEIVGPLHTNYSIENDKSLAIRVVYGNIACLICGDAEKQSELDMVENGENLSAQIYVVDHHGGSTSSMDAFLDAISPQYALISCGSGNGYGHPSMEALQRLQNHDISMYRTDLQGTIIGYSDGDKIWFNQDPSLDWTSGNITETRSTPELTDNIDSEVQEGEDYTYVCNTNTKKFHYPNCNSVPKIKNENRLNTDKTREELIAEGYDPCGNCKP